MSLRFPLNRRAVLALATITVLTTDLPAQSVSVAPASAPSAGASTLSFDLSDQFGRNWRSTELNGQALVLVVGSRSHSDRMNAWSDSLHRAFTTDTASVRWLMVADLRAVPRFMHRMASQRAPREAHRVLLLDVNGTVSQQLGLDRKALTVIVLAPDRHVRLRLIDVAPSTAQVNAVRRLALLP